MKLFKCYQCGYTKEAEQLPDDYTCPLCDEPGTSFLVASYSTFDRAYINEPADVGYSAQTAVAQTMKD